MTQFDWRPACRLPEWRERTDRRWTLAIGVDDSDDRAQLLALGFGEVLPTSVGPVELAARALRIGDNAEALKRFLDAGPVRLDLFHRDGRIGQQWLGLHPREFALLWRLAESAGERVTRRQLLSDVWRIRHDPETNSVEVHVSRLRAKLAVSRAEWLVATDAQGGYRLGSPGQAPDEEAPDGADRSLDSDRTIGNDAGPHANGAQHADETERPGRDRSGG